MRDDPSSPDDRLDAIVAEYYEARDAGQPLTVDELAARHPDLAGQIRTFVQDIESVVAVLQHRRGPSGLEKTAAPSGRRLASSSADKTIKIWDARVAPPSPAHPATGS